MKVTNFYNNVWIMASAKDAKDATIYKTASYRIIVIAEAESEALHRVYYVDSLGAIGRRGGETIYLSLRYSLQSLYNIMEKVQ